MRKSKNEFMEHIIICQELGENGRIEVTIIDSGITEHLIDKLIRIHSKDPEKRYYICMKKDYQIYGAVWKKQIAMTGEINCKCIFELGIQKGK